MQHADEIIGTLAPQRHPRIGRRQHFADDVAGRQIGVDGPDLGAVNHHVGHMHDLQIEHAAEHVARAALDIAFLVHDVDGAHQLVVGRKHLSAMTKLDAGHFEQPAHEKLDAGEQRTEYRNEQMHAARDVQRNLVRLVDRQRLRQHFGENQQHDGHDEGRIDRAVLAEQHDQHAGREGGAADIDQRAAEQQRRDHAVALAQQIRDGRGAPVSVLFERVHMRRRGRRQSRLGARKERGQQHAGEHDDQRRSNIDGSQSGLREMDGRRRSHVLG